MTRSGPDSPWTVRSCIAAGSPRLVT